MPRRTLALLVLLASFVAPGFTAPKGKASKIPLSSPDSKDWASYNYDVKGTRHNVGETRLSRKNVGRLVEKWRFPPRGSFKLVGPVHATPVVVNGYVYVGTAITPTFYKLTPDGKVRWSYRNRAASRPAANRSSGVPADGFLNAALVTKDTVYVGDAGGFLYALNRFTGKERWKIDTRAKPSPGLSAQRGTSGADKARARAERELMAKPFPGAHPSNCIFAAPILADGKVIVAGGGFEHAVGANPKHRCCTGRGFVAAFNPSSGAVLWKYDVGPTPKPLNPPVKIKDAFGEHVFYYGPSTSSVWSTPSYDASTRRIFFGTDTHNSPRQPTKEDPRLYTRHSCALIALDVRTGKEQWVTQINPDDVWNYALCGCDTKTGRYKDQSIGDTPKVYTINLDGKPTRVIGAGCKNGGFYVLHAGTGKILHHTPIYKGPPVRPLKPKPHPRTLALPSLIGGLQTGCATDGKAIFTNGIDNLGLGVQKDDAKRFIPPTGGRVVSISLDTRKENWRHERPKVKAVGGIKEKPAFTNVGDPVASGIALANGVAYFTTTVSGKLVALDTSNGKVLKEIPLGPVWCGPSVSRGRVYVGSGNILFSPFDPREAYFPKRYTGTVYSFGLPGKDEVDRMGKGNE